MKSLYSTAFILFVLLLVICTQLKAQAQPYILEGTEIREIKSKIDGRDYKLIINLPYSYNTDPQKKYPVVYFGDGFYDFPLFTAIYGSGYWDKVIPECLLVGFAYGGENPNNDTLRTFDYTPTVQMKRDSSGLEGGNAARFLKIVREEFIPFIESNYRVDTSFRVLGGSSKGGLFAMYTMFTIPALFDAYMAVSPALDWADDWLLKYEEEFYKKNKELSVSLFMSVAEFDLPQLPQFMTSIKKMNEILGKRDYKNFRYRYRFVEDAHHSGTKAEGYTRAMKFIFAPLMESKTAAKKME